MRRAWVVTCFLAAGAIMNIAIAWTCAIAQLPTLAEDGFYHNPRGEFPLVVTSWRHFGREHISGVARSGTLLDREGHLVKPYRGRAWWPRDAVTETILPAYAVGAGWPMLTLSAWRTTDAETIWPGPNLNYIPVIHWGIEVTATDHNAILPLRPVWPGAIVNTMIYAAALWAFWAQAMVWRRGRRRRRGLCPRCAYEVEGAAICPECGIRLATKAAH